MRLLVPVLALFLLLLAPGSAAALFVGDYDVSHWTTSNGAHGFVCPQCVVPPVDLSAAPERITITGIDGDVLRNFPDVSFWIVAPADATITFDWRYASTDPSAPISDQFGYWSTGVTNGTELPDFFGGPWTGHVTTEVRAGGILGFYILSIDGELGAGVGEISNFTVTQVPSPATATLLVLGLVLAAWSRRRRARPRPTDRASGSSSPGAPE